MSKQKKCRRCHEHLPIERFVDNSGAKNHRGYYCQSCHIEKANEWQQKVEEWRQTVLSEEKSYIPKIKKVYGKYWRHYASPEDFYTTLKDERDFCPYCGTKFDQVMPNKFNKSPYHLDHMDPMHRGGEHSIRNVVFCCGHCNIKKGRLPFQKWLKQLKPKFRKFSREIYTKKHGHSPEMFKEGYNMVGGTYDLEFAIYKSDEELNKKFPKPIVNAPPSNQPIVIELDILRAIESLPKGLKEKLKRKKQVVANNAL